MSRISAKASSSPVHGNSDDVVNEWKEIVLHKPKQAISWITELHRKHDDRLQGPLFAFKGALEDGALESTSRQWPIYAEARITSILMDMLLEQDMCTASHSYFTVGPILFSLFEPLISSSPP